MIDKARIDQLVEASLESDTPEYVEGRGISFEAAGEACGQLARSALENVGLDVQSELPQEVAVRELGGAVTTAALCAFELALRCADERGGQLIRAAVDAMELEPCEHDGWVEGCPRCEANLAAALDAMEAA